MAPLGAGDRTHDGTSDRRPTGKDRRRQRRPIPQHAAALTVRLLEVSRFESWNIADTREAFAQAIPDATAVVHDTRRLTWRDFDRRADGIAATLLDFGLAPQDRVALYLYNCPEYLETFVAATKASLVPVNTNYRYADNELAYLWNDADAAA